MTIIRGITPQREIIWTKNTGQLFFDEKLFMRQFQCVPTTYVMGKKIIHFYAQKFYTFRTELSCA